MAALHKSNNQTPPFDNAHCTDLQFATLNIASHKYTVCIQSMFLTNPFTTELDKNHSNLHHPISCAVERLGKSQDPQQTQQTHPGI